MLWWWWYYPTPSMDGGVEELHGDPTVGPSMDGGVEELHGDPTVGPLAKVWTRGQKWKKWCRRCCAGAARMWDSQGGGESDPAEGVRRRCMKNSPPFYPA